MTVQQIQQDFQALLTYVSGPEVHTQTASTVARRESAPVRARVALTDGAEALQGQLITQLPAYTLVLARIHASEYGWDVANTLLGETNPARAP